MSDSGQRTWRIHLGAHKTGTTHVQDLLALRRTELAEIGIDYPTRAMLRKARFAKHVSPLRGGLKDTRWLVRLRRFLMLRRIRGDRPATTRLISEEQILGLSDGLLRPELYPNATIRLGRLRELTGGEPTTLFLSVRNPADGIPSAYAQCLRVGFRYIPRIEDVIQQALARPPSWTHLARRIKAAFPEAQLVVWRLEDYTRNPGAYLDLLVGKPLDNWPILEAPASTRSLSATTLARIRDLDPGLSQAEHEARCAELAAGDTGQPRYRPFSETEVAALTRAYEADLATMEREFPGMLRRLPAAG